MKKQKGITLVALVITIAIMLILAGVTINISLKGGLFSKANEATSEMQIAAEKEQLLTVALGTLERNGKVNIAELDNNLPEEFSGSNGEYTSKAGNRYQVTEDADIILLDGTEEPEEEPEYTLSGTWKFSPKPIRVETLIEFDADFISNEVQYNGISYDEETSPFGVSYAYIKYILGNQTISVASIMIFIEEYVVSWDESAYQIIDFGSNPQTVSQDDYEWFVTNAIQVENVISFTINETTYYADEGMTWEQWCTDMWNIDYTTDGEYVYDYDNNLIYYGSAPVRANDEIVLGRDYFVQTLSTDPT